MPVGHNTSSTRPDRETLGANLRARRERLGMTQRDLTAITGISQNSISRIEQALADPLVSSVLTLAGAVGRCVELVGEHHLPLLDLTADEVAALIAAANCYIVDTYDGETPALRSALDKLTTTEETDHA